MWWKGWTPERNCGECIWEMSQFLWLKLKWSFSNIFKKSLLFFISDICLMSYFMLCFKIVWWCCSCGKLTFLQSYMRDDVNYVTMSFSFWQRNTFKSFMLIFCSPMAQCLVMRVTSLIIINLCGGGIVCGPSSIGMIIPVSLKVGRILNFDSWCVCCTSLLLRRQMLVVIKNSWKFW